jgi:hypothetical protein
MKQPFDTKSLENALERLGPNATLPLGGRDWTTKELLERLRGSEEEAKALMDQIVLSLPSLWGGG